MQQDERELREMLVTKLNNLLTDIVELKSNLLEVQSELRMGSTPTASEVWLQNFLADYGLSEIDDWVTSVTALLHDPSLLFSSQAISWIGHIKGRAFDDVPWDHWPHSKQVYSRVTLLASDVYRSIYKYRNTTKL